jgi:chemotaxis protein MotB
MPRKKSHETAGNHERWLVSYADFITLLFAFFVVMFATTQADKGKAKQVSDSVKKAIKTDVLPATVAAILGGAVDRKGTGNNQLRGPGGAQKFTPPPPPQPPDPPSMIELQPSLKLLTRELSEEIRKGNLEVIMQPRGLTVSFKQTALFPSGGKDIALDSYASLEKVAAAMQKIPNPVRLEGHTDSVPIHNGRFKSNWELSAARSIALLSLLTGEFGVSSARISIAGYGDTAPIAENETEEGRSRNRRVDIVILNEQGLKGEPQRFKPAP